MKKADIKYVINKLEPDKDMEYRLSNKILSKQHNKLVFKPIAIIAAASLVIIISVGILGYNFADKNTDLSADIIKSKDVILVPKMQIPKTSNASADMKGFIIYQGRKYTPTNNKIDQESAVNLLGEKLGTTKGNVDEWSKQSDYDVEFASSIVNQDVYSVKGYDKNIRIMTYKNISGTYNSQFYECFDEIIVNTGADVFNKLKIENNVKTAKYETFESWNNNKQQYKGITDLHTFNNLINELKNTIPYTKESPSYMYSAIGAANQKFVYITLKDNSKVQLRLFKYGYIFYSNIVFKMENQAFKNLWNTLK